MMAADALAAASLAGRRRAPRGQRWIFWLVTGGAALLLALMLIVPTVRELMRFSTVGSDQLPAALAMGLSAGGWYAAITYFRATREGMRNRA